MVQKRTFAKCTPFPISLLMAGEVLATCSNLSGLKYFTLALTESQRIPTAKRLHHSKLVFQEMPVDTALHKAANSGNLTAVQALVRMYR